MGPRFAIAAGLLAGVGVAAILLIGLLAFAPEPASTSTPAPSIAQVSGSDRPSASARASSTGPSTPTASGRTASGSAGSASASNGGFHIGQPAPALVVPQVGGGTIDLAALRGKPVWVNFMATRCSPCQDEFPLMSGFAARYSATGLVVVAVDVREDEGTVASFSQRLNAAFPLGLDTDGRAAETWGATALPVHVWIDAAGIVRDGAAGGIGADTMVHGLRTILPGVDVTP